MADKKSNNDPIFEDEASLPTHAIEEVVDQNKVTKRPNYRLFYKTKLGRYVTYNLKKKLVNRLVRTKTLWLGYAPSQFYSYFDCVLSDLPIFRKGHPLQEKRQLFLSDYDALPFKRMSWSQIVCLHSFEYIKDYEEFFEQSWNMLEHEGHLFMVVPNVAGFWARGENNAFGAGLPWRALDLKNALEDHKFEVISIEPMLYAFPSNNRFLVRLTKVFDWLGRSFFNPWGGVLLVEAKKSVYSGTLVGVSEDVKTKGFVGSTPMPA